MKLTPACLLVPFAVLLPSLAAAQASPFMTGATALQANARVAREYLVALPVELDVAQRLELARGFSQHLTDRYQFALDLTIHAPRDYPDSDPRNFHAHLLATTREATPHGLTTKTTLEMHDRRRRELGLESGIHELFYVRERWATETNQALRAAHLDVRVDHRTLAAQGIDREPYPHIPRAAFEMERHGYRNDLAERLRREHQERVQARAERVLGLAPEATSTPDKPAVAVKPQSLEEIRRQAREEWLKIRQQAAGSDPAPRERSHDDGHSF